MIANLHRVWQGINQIFERRMGDTLTLPQYLVLKAVNEEAGINQVMIAERTAIDRSTVTGIVERLVKKGLIKRRRARSDRRSYIVSLTKAGEETLQRAEVVVAELDRQIAGSVQKQKEDVLNELRLIVHGLWEVPFAQAPGDASAMLRKAEKHSERNTDLVSKMKAAASGKPVS